jgi:hypothetical protein
MAKTGDPNPEDVVKAFRKAANELGCCQSEERFQEALFAIGGNKPAREPSKRSRRASSRVNSLAAVRRPGSSSK